jgi:NAD(P)H-flavin reductase
MSTVSLSTESVLPAGLHPARVVAREPMAGGLVRIVLDVPSELAATHAMPGQYTTIWLGQSRASFVLASDPGATTWEIMVRSKGPVATALTAPGTDDVLITQALGAGFPLHLVKGKPLVIAAIGSGIAAGRVLVRARVGSGDGANTRLYLGVRTRDDVPLAAEIDSWLAGGCGVVACLSRDAGSTEVEPSKLRLATGYVQHSLEKDLVAAPANRIFVAGSNAMVEAMRELACRLSMDRTDVVTNH